MDGPGATPLGWYPDPSRRHELRFWDGATWTAQVSDRGVVGVDDPNRPAAPVAPQPGYGQVQPGYGQAQPGYGQAQGGYAQGPSGYSPVQYSPSPYATAQGTIPPPPGATWTGSSVPQPFAPAGAPPLASLEDRFLGNLLDGILVFVTLFIGWIVWSCFTYSKGQTPAKQLMGMRVVKQDTGVAAGWGDMFVRQVVIQGGIAIVGSFLLGIPSLVCACMIFGGTLHQTGWDRMLRTVVVKDAQGITVPPGR